MFIHDGQSYLESRLAADTSLETLRHLVERIMGEPGSHADFAEAVRKVRSHVELTRITDRASTAFCRIDHHSRSRVVPRSLQATLFGRRRTGHHLLAYQDIRSSLLRTLFSGRVRMRHCRSVVANPISNGSHWRTMLKGIRKPLSVNSGTSYFSFKRLQLDITQVLPATKPEHSTHIRIS